MAISAFPSFSPYFVLLSRRKQAKTRDDEWGKLQIARYMIWYSGGDDIYLGVIVSAEMEEVWEIWTTMGNRRRNAVVIVRMTGSDAKGFVVGVISALVLDFRRPSALNRKLFSKRKIWFPYLMAIRRGNEHLDNGLPIADCTWISGSLLRLQR